MKSHEEKFNKKKVKIITLISFLVGFSEAMFVYIMSSYFQLASGTDKVGIFYFVAYAFSLLIFLNLHKIIKKIGKSEIFHFSVLIKIILLVFLVVLDPSKLSVLFIIAYIIVSDVEWLSMDIILECFSTDNYSGRIRGIYLTVFNLGFLCGPFLSTKILERFTFFGIFLFLLIFNSIILVVSLVGIRGINHQHERKIAVSGVIKEVLKRKNIMRIYYVSLALEFFFSLMIIYTPIYLRNIGLSWEQIGFIFTIMLVPFVLLQYPAGLLADKKIGEKELLMFALLMMALSSVAIYFIKSNNILIWALVLFSTRIGAALVEILRDSYFYKRIDYGDVHLIDFFRTARPVGNILATGISAILLIFFGIKAAFILAAVFVLSAIYPAFRLTDNKAENEAKKVRA